MKTSIKILIIAIATLLFQSCNMAKHYGNMRISHPKEEINKCEPEVQSVITENIQAPQENKPATTDGEIAVTEPTITKTDTLSKITSEERAIYPTAKSNSGTFKKEKITFLPLKKIMPKTKSALKRKVKLRKPGSSQNEMDIDDWGIVAIVITAVAFIALVIGTGSFLAALAIAVELFLAIMSIIAMGALLYGIAMIFKFLGGGFA